MHAHPGMCNGDVGIYVSMLAYTWHLARMQPHFNFNALLREDSYMWVLAPSYC